MSMYRSSMINRSPSPILVFQKHKRPLFFVLQKHKRPLFCLLFLSLSMLVLVLDSFFFIFDHNSIDRVEKKLVRQSVTPLWYHFHSKPNFLQPLTFHVNVFYCVVVVIQKHDDAYTTRYQWCKPIWRFTMFKVWNWGLGIDTEFRSFVL